MSVFHDRVGHPADQIAADLDPLLVRLRPEVIGYVLHDLDRLRLWNAGHFIAPEPVESVGS